MKLPMDPSVYMCYTLYLNDNNMLKQMAYKWNKEVKTHHDVVFFRVINNDMKRFRKKHWYTPRARGWGSFDMRHLMDFINKYLNL